MASYEKLRSKLMKFRQEHLLRFWDELDENERNSLRKDIEEINWEEVMNFYQKANERNSSQGMLDSVLKPVQVVGSVFRTNADDLKIYESRGLKEISDGHVAALVLAGGQGTRLGVSEPKGMFNMKLPSNKTLFQIQAERLLKLQRIAKITYFKPCNITWYIMTSDATMESTKKFFKDNSYFGLSESSIVMFEQNQLPCFDFQGNILLDEKYKIAKSPDGNGGLYRALKEKGIFEDMSKRGIKYLHAYCVDNILVKVADPVFIGYCVIKNADCGAKVVEKVHPDEPIGVLCNVNGKVQVVEYSEMSPETAQKRNPDNSLMYNTGNICNHFYTTKFLENVANKYERELKLHIAKKKIPYVNESGEKIKPEIPNGNKIEKFIFDVFPFAANFVAWEVERQAEFSALKNPETAEKDNVRTAREDIYRLHKKYIQQAGGEVIGDGPCEISPLVSYAGEGLEVKGKRFDKFPVLIQAPQELKSQQNGTF